MIHVNAGRLHESGFWLLPNEIKFFISLCYGGSGGHALGEGRVFDCFHNLHSVITLLCPCH